MAIFPQYLLDVHDELMVDLFAGGGGASCGIETMCGNSVPPQFAAALARANVPELVARDEVAA